MVYQKCSYKDGVSNGNKCFKLQYMETSPKVFLYYMKPKLTTFIEHNFFARWKDIQFKNLLLTIPKDVVVFVTDFVENDAFKVHNEVQFMHWHIT
jgi:hypothetical protein